jgi:signal transduction histidine kinase
LAVFVMMPTSLLCSEQNRSFYNSIGSTWYHGLESTLIANILSMCFVSLMLYLVGKGICRWKKLNSGQRLYLVCSTLITLLAVADVLVFYEIINFMFTWSLSCALFALMSSLFLGYNALKTSEQLAIAHRHLQSVNAHVLQQQRVSSIALIVRGIVHDLKNFFQATLSLLELCSDAAECGDKQLMGDSLSMLKTNASEAETYLMNMLSMTSEEHEYHAEHVALAKQIENVARICGLRAQSPEIEVDIDIPDKLTIKTDALILQQVLLNLTFNAVQSLPKTSGALRRLAYKAERVTDGVCLTIEDSGPGLPEKAIEVLNSKEDSLKLTAKGIGLRLVRDGCDKMGARLQHESGDNNIGTRFRIHFDQLIT